MSYFINPERLSNPEKTINYLTYPHLVDPKQAQNSVDAKKYEVRRIAAIVIRVFVSLLTAGLLEVVVCLVNLEREKIFGKEDLQKIILETGNGSLDKIRIYQQFLEESKYIIKYNFHYIEKTQGTILEKCTKVVEKSDQTFYLTDPEKEVVARGLEEYYTYCLNK